MADRPLPQSHSAPDEMESLAAAPSRNLRSLKLLWRLARQYPGHIVIALLALLTAAVATMAIPAAFMAVVDEGFGAANHAADSTSNAAQSAFSRMLMQMIRGVFGGAPGDIAPYFYFLLAIIVVQALATAVRFYFVSWLGERVVADLRLAVQRNLLRQQPGFFEANRPAEIASRMTADTAIVEQIVGTTVSVALRNIVIAVLGIAFLLALAPKLTAIMLAGIVVVVLPITILGKRLSNLSRTSQDRVADIGSQISEVLGAMKIVQAFGQQGREAERFAGAVENGFATAKRRIALRAVMTAVVMALIFGAITLLMWLGANAVKAGTISGGTIAGFVLAGGLIAGAFGALTEVFGDIMRGAGAASRMDELLRAEPTIKSPARPAALPTLAAGAITFDHVFFRYPTRPDHAALDDFTLAVAPKETIALVGPSGAGKTTVFQLAERFYDPDAGRVLLDGVDIRDADPADVRARLAIVPQDTVLFAASARDNLRYGNWDASDDAIWSAARAANAEQFLRDLPQGLDTDLGEGGARLSGGQRQRIAIARALLRAAPILLLDEATSALDAESERAVQEALDRLMDGRTTIVIAHRLSTVRAADRIIVMDNGRIVEQGRHDDLIAQKGLYARLARLQFDH